MTRARHLEAPLSAPAEFTCFLHFEPEVGRASKPVLRILDDRLESAGLGHVAGTADMAGLDFVAKVDLFAAYHRPQLDSLLVELGLADKCRLELAPEADYAEE